MLVLRHGHSLVRSRRTYENRAPFNGARNAAKNDALEEQRANATQAVGGGACSSAEKSW